MKPGTYKAYPKGLAVKQTENGKPYMRAYFEVQMNEGAKVLPWTGWLTPKANPYTLKNLFKIGLTAKSLRQLLAGAKGDECINTNDLVEVTVGHSTDKDGKKKFFEDGSPMVEVTFIGARSVESDKDALNSLDKNTLLGMMAKVEGREGGEQSNPSYQVATDFPF